MATGASPVCKRSITLIKTNRKQKSKKPSVSGMGRVSDRRKLDKVEYYADGLIVGDYKTESRKCPKN
ncbi:MAG: hypothetical protein IPJ06_16800 [Saprospiraceae bacterium]|nr:hypothetical protein [Saprospiraceae bacterium]